MAPLLRKLHASGLPGHSALVGLRPRSPHSLPSCSSEGLRGGYLNQVPHWREGSLPWHCGGFFLRSSFYLFSSWVDQVYGNPGSSSSSMPLQRGSSCLFTRSMAMKTHVDRKKRDLARREFQLLRRKAKLMKATMSPEERLLWRLKKANRKKAVLLQRLKKYELEQDPEPVHDPELITPEQLQAFKKIGYKNRNYVPVGRRGVYGGVVLNMHMHWKFHETVQVDCHIFKQEDIRTVARQLAVLSGGIVIDVHQSTTIIMYRGRNYTQPKAEMTPPNTLTKRKALFKSKFLQALDGLNTNIRNIEAELQVIRRKQKESVSQTGENDSSKPQQIGEEKVGSIAVAELSEVSSEDDDDGIFSWESDSLDEDELSDDDEFDYKKAEDTHREKTKANKPICWTSEESARRRGRTDPRVAKELVTAEQKLFKNSQNRHAVHVQDKGLDSSEDDKQHDNNDADLDENLADSDDDNNVESGDDVTDDEFEGGQSSHFGGERHAAKVKEAVSTDDDLEDDEFEGGQSSHFGGERHAAKVKEAVSTDDDLEDDVERQSSHCDGKKTAKIKKAASTGKKRKQFRNKKIARFVSDFINEEDEEQHEEFGSEFDDPDDFNDNSKGSNSAGKGTSRGGK